jgi:MFS superfamily sulfate permease-like transporter
MDKSPAIRFDGREWLGAFGDIGVLVPILLSLAVVNGIDLTRALTLTGLAYIGSALYFRLPVPVQPLKAMAAIALAQGLGLNVIRAGSFWMGVILLALAATGSMKHIAKLFPRPIVKGLQLGVGILLLKTAWKMFAPLRAHAVPSLAPMPPLAPRDFLTSFFVLVLPQIPLTLGNAVFGASDALHVYYGEEAEKASPTRLCTSIGLINIVVGLLNGYPLCHGSGGVTAHRRLGARTAGATMIIGGTCLVLAFILGEGSYRFLSNIPTALLGALLLYVGIFHGLLVLGLERSGEYGMAIAMGAVVLASNRLDWALGVGLAIYAIVNLWGPFRNNFLSLVT